MSDQRGHPPRSTGRKRIDQSDFWSQSLQQGSNSDVYQGQKKDGRNDRKRKTMPRRRGICICSADSWQPRTGKEFGKGVVRGQRASIGEWTASHKLCGRGKKGRGTDKEISGMWPKERKPGGEKGG